MDGNKFTPPAFLRDMVVLEQRDQVDPASTIPGVAPNFARYPVAHIDTFQGFASSIANVYRDYDEAVKDSLENARYMRNDCGIMECLEARQRGAALLNWHLEPEDPDSADQKALCDDLTKILQSIRRFTEYRRCLLEAIWYGKQGIQHRYGYQTVNGKSRIVPKPIGENPGWSPINGDKLVVRYPSDHLKQGQFPWQLGIRVGAGRKAGDMINGRWKVEPTDRGMAYFLMDFERKLVAVHKHSIEDGAYEDVSGAGSILGVGVRSRIYWDWMQKQEALGFLVDYLERAAGGIEIWRYPQGNPQAKSETEDAIKNRASDRRSAWMVPVPPGEEGMQYGVEVIEPGLGGIDILQQLLNNYYGHRIKRYILGQVLTTEAESTGLGSGVADAHIDSFMQIVKYDATNLEETMTWDLVKPIKDWNYPAARDINVRFVIETQEPDVEEKLKGMETAYNMGARIKESDVLDAVGVATPTAEDRVLQNPQLAAPPAQDPAQQQPRGRSQGTVPADIDTSPEAIAEQAMQGLHGSVPDDQASMYVKEGDDWNEREIPDSTQDTGDRHKVASYAKGDKSKFQLRDKRGRFADESKLFTAFVDRSISAKPSEYLSLQCGHLPKRTAAQIEQETGTDVSQYSVFVDNHALRHIVNHHGVEHRIGQLPITKEDLYSIVRIMKWPDKIEIADQRGELKAVRLRKTIGNHLFVVTELRTGKKRLALKTMMKYPAGKKNEAEAPASTSETFPPRKGRRQSHSASESIIDRESYARNRKSATGQGEFRWITIGGDEEGDKKHAGGTAVRIESATGKIVSGPPALEGKKINELGDKHKSPKNSDPDDVDEISQRFSPDSENHADDHESDRPSVKLTVQQLGKSGRWYAMTHLPDGGLVTRSDESRDKAIALATADVEAHGLRVDGDSDQETEHHKPDQDSEHEKEQESSKATDADESHGAEHPDQAESSEEDDDSDSTDDPVKDPDVGDGPGAPPTQASLFTEAIENGIDPREAAEHSQRKDDPDYEFARQSAIGNAGEDLKGSARHKVNSWRSLEEAEEDGTAAEMVTRANLLKAEPHNLLTLSEDNPLTAVAMHLALNRFPANPLPTSKKVKVDDETAKKDRSQYLDAYRSVKEKAEKLAADESDPAKAIEDMAAFVSAKIKDLRGIKGNDYMAQFNATDRYNNTANNLVDLLNGLVSYKQRQKTHIANRIGELAKAFNRNHADLSTGERREKLTEIAQDLIEGNRTFSSALGEETGGKSRPGYFSPADVYVGHAKRTGGKDVSDVTKDPNEATAHMLEHFGMRGVQWGNSVTDDERSHHAEKVVEAFTDLIDVIGLRPQDASLDGKLGLAIGARGHGTAAAHYEPGSKVINLTRKSGVGALAHEWGHGFDHLLGGFGIAANPERGADANYFSEMTSPKRFAKDETQKMGVKVDESGKAVVVNHSEEPLFKAMDGLRKQWKTGGFRKRLGEVCDRMIKDGLMSEGKRKYWTSTREMFARCFESWIAHKLKTQGRENTYLSGLESHGLWPTAEEVDAMSPHFEALFEGYRQKHGITEKYSRSEIMRYFRQEIGRVFSTKA